MQTGTLILKATIYTIFFFFFELLIILVVVLVLHTKRYDRGVASELSWKYLHMNHTAAQTYQTALGIKEVQLQSDRQEPTANQGRERK